MSGDQLDQYMDWYEDHYIDDDKGTETKAKGMHKELLNMFPTGRLDGSSRIPYTYAEQVQKERAATDEALQKVVGSLSVRPIVSEDDEAVDRAGSSYKRYKKASNMEENARFFHERVADMLGIKLQTLMNAVAQVEMKLLAYKKAKVKEGKGGGRAAGADAGDHRGDVESMIID